MLASVTLHEVGVLKILFWDVVDKGWFVFNSVIINLKICLVDSRARRFCSFYYIQTCYCFSFQYNINVADFV